MSYRPTRPFLDAEVANTWRFKDFPSETTVGDLLRPETWAHCSGAYFKTLDEIIVVPQGAPFRAHLIILDAAKNYAKVRLLDVTYLNGAEAKPELYRVTEALACPAPEPLPEGSPLSVEWKGPKHKFCVVRAMDGEIIMRGFAIKAEAEAEARKHLLAMA